MSKSIIITESQYRRLMLVEQTYNAKKNPEQKDGRYYTYTPQEKEFESLMSDIQVWKMQKSQGLAGSNHYCKDPCSTTVTGTIKGDIDKGVICVNYNLLHNDGYICKEGYGMRSLVAKEYGTLDHNTIREMTKKLPTIKGATLVDFVKKNRHEIIDVLSVATFFIPIVGPFISVGLEGVNSAMYLVEGDHLGAGLSAIFMLIPIGGPLLRRATMPAIKKTAKFMDYVVDIEKRSQLNEFEKKRLINESWEKLGKTEQKLVQELKQPDNVAKLNDFKRLGEGGVKKYLKKNKDTYKKILKVETSIGKGSRFLDEFMNPTWIEKYLFAGSILGMIYLDKSGKMKILTQDITKWLMEVRGISQEEAPIAIINIEETTKKYEKKLTSTPVDQRDVIIMEMAEEIEVKMDYFGNLPKNHPSRKMLMSISDTDKIKIVNKKLKKLKVVDYSSLGEWDSVWYKNYCSKNKSVTLPSNVTIIDLQEKLTNSPDGKIKSKHLGNNWEYAKLDGLWFTRKVNTEEWLLVTKCVANNKIEVEYEKVVDPDVDKKSEFDSLMYQHLKNAGFDINQYIGLFNDEKK